MHHRTIRKRFAAGIDALLAGAVALPHDLYPYQTEALQNTINWLLDLRGTKRGYIAHATGLGKTVLLSALIHACPKLRFLIVVPTKVLIEQTAPAITRFTKSMVGHVSSLKRIHDEDGNVIALPGYEYTNVVVTTDESFVQKAGMFKRQFQPHIIIWDECHWAYHPRARHALAQFDACVIIGLSATPDSLTTVAKPTSRAVLLENGRTLYADPNRLAATHFQTKIDERSVRWGIEEGWLAPFAWGRITFDCSLDGVASAETPSGTDYNEQQLQARMAAHWHTMTETIVRLYHNGEYDLPNRQTFSACPSILACEHLATSLRAIGIPAASISANTPTHERRDLLDRFRRNEIRHLSSVMVLREGVDAPNAEVCLMLRPTKSRTFYFQYMGRVLRLMRDNPHKVALVLDAHFQRAAIAPLSAPRLFAAPGQEVRELDILVGPDAGPRKPRKPRKPRDPRDPPRKPRKKVIASPYLLPDGVEPRIVVMDALDDIEYWAGDGGTFEADGEVWGTINVFADTLGCSSAAIKYRIEDHACRKRMGRNRSGTLQTFYALSDVRRACADLLQDVPEVNDQGTFEADREIWGTIRALAMMFGLTPVSIKHRIKNHACRKRTGRDRTGHPRTFYALSDVRRACADLLQDISEVNDQGTFEADGEVWGTIKPFATMLGFAQGTIKRRVKDHACRKRMGRNRSGTLQTFYALSDVRRACADLLGKKSRRKK
ncbi:MAG: DEAD/DEAH box helicase family protein, partial [bacterium]|nr:DEAD/DEAH box helicase family protein [bacterium]